MIYKYNCNSSKTINDVNLTIPQQSLVFHHKSSVFQSNGGLEQALNVYIALCTVLELFLTLQHHFCFLELFHNFTASDVLELFPNLIASFMLSSI